MLIIKWTSFKLCLIILLSLKLLNNSVNGWKWLTLASIGSVIYDPNSYDNDIDYGDEDTSHSPGYQRNSFNSHTRRSSNNDDTTMDGEISTSKKISRTVPDFLCKKRKLLSKIGLDESVHVLGGMPSFCQSPEDLELLQSIQRGANIALTECQKQFKDRRWNCTLFRSTPSSKSTAPKSGESRDERGLDDAKLRSTQIYLVQPETQRRESRTAVQDDVVVQQIIKDGIKNLGKLLNSGTREAAFVHAISSAGLAYAITRACSLGKLSRCGCDMSLATEESPAKMVARALIEEQPQNAKQHHLINNRINSEPAYSDEEENVIDNSNNYPSSIADTENEKFYWAGCSDNTAFGTAFARNFVDTREEKNFRRKRNKILEKLKAKGHDKYEADLQQDSKTRNEILVQGFNRHLSYGLDEYKRNHFRPIFNQNRELSKEATLKRKLDGLVGKVLTNLHNSGAGRKAVESSVQIYCKCHGASGSCELKTCWRALPSSFAPIGQGLKNKFDGATEVRLLSDMEVDAIEGERESLRHGLDSSRQPNAGSHQSRKVLVAAREGIKPHSGHDLVYTRGSPDFCEPRPKLGYTTGTRGRKCDSRSTKLDGCDLMCCGRGHLTKVVKRVNQRCRCKFKWCCYVTCARCNETVYEDYCL